MTQPPQDQPPTPQDQPDQPQPQPVQAPTPQVPQAPQTLTVQIPAFLQGAPFYTGNNWLGRQTRVVQSALAAAVAVVLVVCMCAGIAAAAGGGGKSTAKTDATPTATATLAPTATSQPTATPDTGDHEKVGATIEITAGNGTDVAVTLVSAKSYASAQYTSPKAGHVYVVCDVKIENKGTSSYDYNEFDFYLLDGSGNIGNSTFAGTDLTPNQLNSGTLTPGGHVQGQLVFEVPQGDHAAQLTWQPTYSTPKDKFTWNLGL